MKTIIKLFFGIVSVICFFTMIWVVSGVEQDVLPIISLLWSFPLLGGSALALWIIDIIR